MDTKRTNSLPSPSSSEETDISCPFGPVNTTLVFTKSTRSPSVNSSVKPFTDSEISTISYGMRSNEVSSVFAFTDANPGTSIFNLNGYCTELGATLPVISCGVTESVYKPLCTRDTKRTNNLPSPSSSKATDTT